jgi:ATP-dependent Lon protease
VPDSYFRRHDLHIHVPAGAIPKDGPSAGITMATAIASIAAGRKERPRVAMTGEITLTGRVLPVGGIKEKVLAARRAGIREVILAERNRRDVVEDVPEQVKGDLTFHYVKEVDEVFRIALEPEGETAAPGERRELVTSG